MEMLLRPLSTHGWVTKFAHAVEEEDFEAYDLFVFCQPNLSANLIDGVKQCLRLDKAYYVYLNDDFHHLPQSHPAYHHFGPGNPKALEVLEIILENSQGLIVPSQVLSEQYQKYVKKVDFIPPAWSKDNPLWSKNAPSRSTFNIGWLGSGGDRADLQSIKKEILKLMKTTPNVFLVIIGDPMGYELFSELSEQRRIFLPLSNYEDTPYVLSHVDLLLVPLRQNDYNRARSDLPLLEAGVRCIPWLASPIPAFEEWKVGGQLVENADEWLTAMQSMVKDVNLRREFGQAGMAKARTREIEEILETWKSALTMS
jgi:glycosyltransferase involved in cell wall biosynthesis